MGLVHVRKEVSNLFGHQSWTLYDPQGIPIASFSAFCAKLIGLRFATRLRYTTVVARFIDYLYEVKALGAASVSRTGLNEAIEYYLALLRSGDAICLAAGTRERAHYSEGGEEREKALRKIAQRLGISPLASGSWDNTLAALNMFLRLCVSFEHEAKEIAILKGGVSRSLVRDIDWDYRSFFDAVDGVAAFSSEEIQHIKQSTMLGGVIRFRGSELTRPKGIRKSFRQTLQIDVSSIDFPLKYFDSLLSAATSWRDRALWTLMLASGIRRSEALNIQWCDIDFTELEVYVLDPYLLRYGRNISKTERDIRFKGRTVSLTYLFQPYREKFFYFLKKYREEEYRLPLDGNEFVFQYLIKPNYGRPLVEASDVTLNDMFKSAVRRAQIPGPPIAQTYTWTAHSLRHAYGVYMLNDYPASGDGRSGLSLSEVQMLMGHRDIGSTRKYARERTSRLKEKLKNYDEIGIQGNEFFLSDERFSVE